MVNLELNRMRYVNVSSSQKDAAIAEEWQKQNGQQKNKKDEVTPQQNEQLSQRKSLERKQLKSLSNINQVRSIQAIDRIDAVTSIEKVEAVEGISNNLGAVNLKDAGRFDIKQDVADFVRPSIINQDYLTKDSLAKTGQHIVLQLNIIGASEALIQRAENLFNEETTVKSVTDAYKNALIFA